MDSRERARVGVTRSSPLVTYDREQAARLERIFAQDVRNSRRVDLERWQARGLWHRFREWLSLPVRSET